MSGTDPLALSTNTVTAAYSLAGNDYVLFFDPTAGYAVTLPDATKNTGRLYVLVQTVSNAGQVTVKAVAGKVNTAAAGTGVTLTASKIGLMFAVSNGTDWFVGGGTATFT